MTTISRSLPSTARAVLRRWPTLLAVALFALVVASDAADLAPTLTLLPACYALALAVGRRWTWPLVAAAIGVNVVLAASDVDPRTALVVVASASLGAAVVHGRGRREVALQALGVLVFGGASFLAVSLSPHAAAVLVAAAWFGHGLWDAVHLHRDAVVSRSFAEWCAVIDILAGAAIVLTTTSWVA